MSCVFSKHSEHKTSHRTLINVIENFNQLKVMWWSNDPRNGCNEFWSNNLIKFLWPVTFVHQIEPPVKFQYFLFRRTRVPDLCPQARISTRDSVHTVYGLIRCTLLKALRCWITIFRNTFCYLSSWKGPICMGGKHCGYELMEAEFSRSPLIPSI